MVLFKGGADRLNPLNLSQYMMLRSIPATGKVQFGISSVWLSELERHVELMSLFMRAYIIVQLGRVLQLLMKYMNMVMVYL